MKGKKSIIISSLIMCLTLIVAIVSVTAAWFGNVTQQSVTDLEIGSGTTSASADVDITSGQGSGQTLIPAIVNAGSFGTTKAYPGNYFVKSDDLNQKFDKDVATALDPSKFDASKTEFKDAAQPVSFIVSIRYVGPGDNETGNKKSVQLKLLGAYLAGDLTNSGSDDNITYSGYEKADADGRNFKNEFNVKMSLVNSKDLNDDTSYAGDATFSNEYTEDNPYGHILSLTITSTVQYYVKFEVYFNKVDEECNPELLHANLVLHIKLETNVPSSPSQP